MIKLNRLFPFSVVLIFVVGTFSSCDGMRESTKKHSPQDTVTYQSGELEIAISYSKPYKKERVIFGTEEDGALVPYGEAWRTGANEATEIKLSRDIRIGEGTLAAGTYSLYTIPGKDKWVVAINSNTQYWGRGFFDVFDEEKDVLRADAMTMTLDNELEQFTIDFIEEGDMAYIRFMWDDTAAMLPFKP